MARPPSQLDYAPPPRWHCQPVWRSVLRGVLLLGVIASVAWGGRMAWLTLGWLVKGGDRSLEPVVVKAASQDDARRIAAEVNGGAFRRRVVEHADRLGAGGAFTPNDLYVEAVAIRERVFVTGRYAPWTRTHYDWGEMSMVLDQRYPEAARRNDALERGWNKAVEEAARPPHEQAQQ